MSINLHDDAYSGALTEDLLRQYLTGGRASIDSVGGEKKLTPLASACLRGHIDVVNLLLKNGANPDATSSRERPPLFYVTSRTTKNRLGIVRVLLDAGAEVDKRFPKDGNATALMNAITEVRDTDVVHELVDHGASLDAKNSGGQSARDLAKEVGMEQELLSKNERNAKHGAIIDLIVALVMFVIAYVNSGIIKDVALGTISKLYDISGAKDKDQTKYTASKVLGSEAAKNFAKHLENGPAVQISDITDVHDPKLPPGSPPSRDSKLDADRRERKREVDQAEFCLMEPSPRPPKVQEKRQVFGENTNITQVAKSVQREPKPTVEKTEPPLVTITDFKDNLSNYVQETGLEKFFARGDPFIQNLAERAAALSQDHSTPLSKPENIKRLITLSLYHPVIYCDDSGSMSLDNRFPKQQHLVSRMARIATKIVPDGCGVDLRFINARIIEQNLSTGALDRYLANTQPRGGTRIGTVLRRDILTPLVYRKIDAGAPFQRPLLVCAITDGDPSSEPPSTFKDVIVECRRKLVAAGYEPTSVMFCISQIGDDAKATTFLAGLRDDDEIQDMLYCTTERLDGQFEEMKANEARLEEWLLKLLTKPIMERYEE